MGSSWRLTCRTACVAALSPVLGAKAHREADEPAIALAGRVGACGSGSRGLNFKRQRAQVQSPPLTTHPGHHSEVMQRVDVGTSTCLHTLTLWRGRMRRLLRLESNISRAGIKTGQLLGYCCLTRATQAGTGEEFCSLGLTGRDGGVMRTRSKSAHQHSCPTVPTLHSCLATRAPPQVHVCLGGETRVKVDA